MREGQGREKRKRDTEREEGACVRRKNERKKQRSDVEGK